MGGVKASGLGSRHGAGGIRKYCSQQAIVVTSPRCRSSANPLVPLYAPRDERLGRALKLLYGRGKRD